MALCAAAAVVGVARAQVDTDTNPSVPPELAADRAALPEDREEIAIRAVPVQASTISTLRRSAENQLESADLIVGDATRAKAHATTVIPLENAFGASRTYSVTGGMDSAVARSVQNTTYLEPLPAGGSSQLGLKALLARIGATTVIVGSLIGLGTLLYRYTGGKAF